MIRIEIKEISKGHAGISLEAEKTDSIEVLQLAMPPRPWTAWRPR